MIFKVVKKRRRKYNNVGLVILQRFMKKGIYTSHHPFILYKLPSLHYLPKSSICLF